MKKQVLFAAAAAVMMLSSCSTITHTATTEGVDTEIYNRSNAALDVASKKITYTYQPDASHRRAGKKAVLRAAVAKALEANGDGDVLVAPQFEVKETRGLFTTKIKYVTVKGYPANYKNVHATSAEEAQVVNILDGGQVIINK
ncbi:MAG: hypothetical protein HDS69_01465 [Bacteroidales bacterium]|nr:hypothetical protein [Bacteroidales bacterium]MBD5258386.1 hypothetical protein [Barnesiella sp.]